MKTGDKVGSKRWPMSACHPDAWGKPWSGILLARTDVRAWSHCMAFHDVPTEEQVIAHLAWCDSQGDLLSDRVPVLWEFGNIYWQSASSLRAYDEDLADWEEQRVNEYRQYMRVRAA